MKARRLFPAMVCFLFVSGSLIAADAPKTPPPMTAEQKAMMDVWMKAATPGDAHHKLAALEGTWDAKVMTWMAPGAPPEVSGGTMTNKMILGGRYLEQRFEGGTMMGMPFSGLGYTGYDNVKKMYVSTWMDSMDTSIMDSTGTQDPTSGVMTFVGTSVDPVSGKAVEVKEAITVKDADHHVFEMWGPGPDGKVMKNMEIEYTRKK